VPFTVAARRPATVLVVDQSEPSQCAAARALAAAGFHVVEAASGAEALQKTLDGPELVVLDTRLPDMSGNELCRRIKADPATSAIPVVHLSTDFTSSAYRAQGLAEGADAYLVHPFEQAELVALVNALLRMRDAEAARIRERTSEVEGRYQMVFEHTPLPMWVIDLASLRYLAVNQAAIAKYGYTREEWLEMRVADLQVPDAVDAFLRTIEAKRKDPVIAHLCQHRRKDGSLLDVEIVAHGFTFEGNAARLVIGKDVTAQRRADAAIRASERQLRAQFMAIPVPTYAWRAQGGDFELVDYNTAALEITRNGVRESLGTMASEMFAHRPDILADIRDCLTEDRTVRREMTYYMAATDELKELAVSYVPVQPDMVLVHTADETGRRAADEELRFRASLLDAVEQAVIATTPEGRITYWNRFAERLYGWNESEVRGRNIIEVTPHEVTRAQAEVMMQRLAAGESWSGEFIVRTREGRRVLAHVTDSPIFDGAGTLIGVVGVSFDTSDRRALEEQLRQSQKLEAVGKLAGGVAHDFNNLLTVIRGSNEFVREMLPPDAEIHAEVDEIAAATERAAALTRQLLAFSRKQMLTLQVLDVNAVVVVVERMLTRLIGEDIALRTVLDPALGTVLADRGQIEQVLMNLAVNARDAMPLGGTLTITTANVQLEEDASTLGVDVRPGAYVMLAVRDTGHGMDPATLEHAFEPFFTTKGVGHGTGLGLSTVYGIVRQSGGSIRAFSEPGAGAEFKIYLPQREQRVAAATAAARRDVRGTERVLLVEDEEPVRRVARRVLEKLGYSVVEAPDGPTAVALFREHGDTIDLVVSDTVMPEMDGRALVEALRRLRRDVPALYMSGYTDDEIVRRGVDPSSAFLQKPFTAQSLGAAVRDTLDRAVSGRAVSGRG
jgi:two-component system cell cycle sensor histidine kinase/response regulator CckA